MKKFGKLLSLGALFAVVGIAGATQSYAQSDCDDVDGYTALDTKIRENYAKVATLPEAIKAGKEFLEKYGDCKLPDADGAHPTAGMTAYLKDNLAKWEKTVADAKEAERVAKLYTKFDDGIKNSKFDDVYSAGREIVALKPNNSLDQIIPMGAIGIYQSYNKNYAYNDETLRYARMAIDKIKAGEVSGNKAWGVYNYSYGSKEDALSEMTYALGYILYVVKNDKDQGLKYLYEVAQMPGRNKNEPRVYTAFADYYAQGAAKIIEEIKPLEAELVKEDTLPERKIELDKMIKEKEALIKAFAERTADAYSRAYSFTKNSTQAEKDYRKSLYEQIQNVYKIRFGPDAKGVDTWISSTTSKPVPNPLSAVTPIAIEEEPATTTSTAPAGASSGKATAAVSRP